MAISRNSEFASLFKKYRLRSEIETLTELGNLLAEVSVVYENSLYSRWQKGLRIPKDRNLLIKIIILFAKRKGISTPAEANKLLASVGERDLTGEELNTLRVYFAISSFTVPEKLPTFVGREKVLKDVCWHLLNRKAVILYGLAGAGKTAIAIQVAHVLKEKYPSGVLWYRYDMHRLDGILIDLARRFGEDIPSVVNKERLLPVILSILRNRKILLIFDNVDNFEDLQLLMNNQDDGNSILITTHKPFLSQSQDIINIKIQGLLEHEVIELAVSMLGRPFVFSNLSTVKELSNKYLYSPLALKIVYNQIIHNPKKLDKYLHDFGKEVLQTEDSSYQNKDLLHAFDTFLNSLEEKVKNVAISVGVFEGQDFTVEAVSFLHNLDNNKCKRVLHYLNTVSWIESSREGRYRIHPLIKYYLRNRFTNKAYYIGLHKYYLEKFSKSFQNTEFNELDNELGSVLGLMSSLYRYQCYIELVNIWEYIHTFFWDAGRWKEVMIYGNMVVKACENIQDKNRLSLVYIRDLSWLYYWQGKKEKARKTIVKGLNYIEEINSFTVALAKQRLGVILQSEKKYSEALAILKESLIMFTGLSESSRVADNLLYIGHVYKNLGDISLATEYYKKSLQLGRNSAKRESVAIALYYLGEINLLKKSFTSALKYFQESLELDQASNRKAGIAWCLYGYGRVYNFLGKKSLAKQALSASKELFKKLGNVEQSLIIEKDVNSLV